MNQIYDEELMEQRIEEEWKLHYIEMVGAKIDHDIRDAEKTAEWLDETSD